MWENEEEKSSRYHVLLAGALLEAAVEQNKQQTSRAALPATRAKKQPSAWLPSNPILHTAHCSSLCFHVRFILNVSCGSIWNVIQINYMICRLIHWMHHIYFNICSEEPPNEDISLYSCDRRVNHQIDIIWNIFRSCLYYFSS